jgi:uncharacterized membrane protein
LLGVATGVVGLTAVGLTVALTVAFVVFFVMLAVAFTDGLNVVCGALVHPHIATTTPARTHNVRNFMAFFIIFTFTYRNHPVRKRASISSQGSGSFKYLQFSLSVAIAIAIHLGDVSVGATSIHSVANIFNPLKNSRPA